MRPNLVRILLSIRRSKPGWHSPNGLFRDPRSARGSTAGVPEMCNHEPARSALARQCAGIRPTAVAPGEQKRRGPCAVQDVQ